MNHLSEQQVVGYCQQKLAADQLLMMSEHLQDCAPCSERLTSVLKANQGSRWADKFPSGDLSALDENTISHLTYEQVAGVVENSLNASEQITVNEHIHACTSCQAEVQDLLQFKQSLAPETPKNWQSLAPTHLPTQW